MKAENGDTTKTAWSKGGPNLTFKPAPPPSKPNPTISSANSKSSLNLLKPQPVERRLQPLSNNYAKTLKKPATSKFDIVSNAQVNDDGKSEPGSPSPNRRNPPRTRSIDTEKSYGGNNEKKSYADISAGRAHNKKIDGQTKWSGQPKRDEATNKPFGKFSEKFGDRALPSHYNVGRRDPRSAMHQKQLEERKERFRLIEKQRYDIDFLVSLRPKNHDCPTWLCDVSEFGPLFRSQKIAEELEISKEFDVEKYNTEWQEQFRKEKTEKINRYNATNQVGTETTETHEETKKTEWREKEKPAWGREEPKSAAATLPAFDLAQMAAQSESFAKSVKKDDIISSNGFFAVGGFPGDDEKLNILNSALEDDCEFPPEEDLIAEEEAIVLETVPSELPSVDDTFAFQEGVADNRGGVSSSLISDIYQRPPSPPFSSTRGGDRQHFRSDVEVDRLMARRNEPIPLQRHDNTYDWNPLPRGDPQFTTQHIRMTQNLTFVPGNWFYQDPNGKIQGPFTSKQMRIWLDKKFFNQQLKVSRNDPVGVYLPLINIFPDLSRAFMEESRHSEFRDPISRQSPPMYYNDVGYPSRLQPHHSSHSHFQQSNFSQRLAQQPPNVYFEGERPKPVVKNNIFALDRPVEHVRVERNPVQGLEEESLISRVRTAQRPSIPTLPVQKTKVEPKQNVGLELGTAAPTDQTVAEQSRNPARKTSDKKLNGLSMEIKSLLGLGQKAVPGRVNESSRRDRPEQMDVGTMEKPKDQETAVNSKGDVSQSNPWKTGPKVDTNANVSLKKIQEEEQKRMKQAVENGTYQSSQPKAWANLVAQSGPIFESLPPTTQLSAEEQREKERVIDRRKAEVIQWCKAQFRTKQLQINHKFPETDINKLFATCLEPRTIVDVRNYFESAFGSTPEVSSFADEFIARKSKLFNISIQEAQGLAKANSDGFSTVPITRKR